jgi:hypothetical protein
VVIGPGAWEVMLAEVRGLCRQFLGYHNVIDRRAMFRPVKGWSFRRAQIDEVVITPAVPVL